MRANITTLGPAASLPGAGGQRGQYGLYNLSAAAAYLDDTLTLFPAPYPRVLVTGLPRCGKSVEAGRIADVLQVAHADVRRCDELVGLPWSTQSQVVVAWMGPGNDGPSVIEGCTVVRALRKFVSQRPGERPADVVVFLHRHKTGVTAGQARMAAQVAAMWADEVRPALISLGVEIFEEG